MNVPFNAPTQVPYKEILVKSAPKFIPLPLLGRLSSLRLGFANNSSSTHSILIGGSDLPAVSAEDYFGWNWFHLKSKEDRECYAYNYLLGGLRYMYYAHGVENEDQTAIEKELCEALNLTNPPPVMELDHQSCITLPTQFGKLKGDPDFIRAVYNFLAYEPHITILGGSDNDDPPKQFRNLERIRTGRLLSYNSNELVVRKDGKWFVTFDQRNGTKSRLILDLSDQSEYTYSSTPELVDLKITDYCAHGCAFCYMGSTKKGKHVPFDELKPIIDKLAQAKVFEIALGGGEPTQHPEFIQIIEYIRSVGIVPNFTTFNMDFTLNSDMVTAVKKFAGAFAVSSIDLNVLQDILTWNNAVDHKTAKATAQIAIAAYPEKELRPVLDFIYNEHIPVTFLGFKTVGRGAKFNPHDTGWLQEYLVKFAQRYQGFGADTLFVAQWRNELKTLCIAPELIVGSEGQFSCYIDAVTKTMGPSSYMPEQMHPYKIDQLLSQFPYQKD